jgi:hypothetical protein
MAGNIILTAAYGADVELDNDPLVTLAEETLKIAELLARPGHYLVDAVPMLQYLPRWFPGATFRREAESYSKIMQHMREIPYNQVKDQMVS